MKLLIRLVFAAALLGACFATPATAQYMFLDVNGDGINTDADDLNANGTPTVATLYVITNQNEDGSTPLCNQNPETPLTINSYAVNFQAVGGQVVYSDFVNLQEGMTTHFGEVNADSVYYKNGYGGPTALDPGKYALATVTITGVSGSPSVEIIDLSPGSADFTSFGTRCDGNDFDSTYKLTGPGGGTDWTDVAGLGPGPGGNAFPVLDVPTEVVGSVGTPVLITATATDPDASDVLTITYTTTATFLTDFTHTPSVSPATATLGGTPPELSQGQYQVMWSVSDGHNDPVTVTTLVNITEGGGPNDCPVLTPIGNLTGNELELLTFAVTATDADPGQSVTFSLGEGAPDGANLNADTGIFTWTPSEEQGPGVYNITFRATDNASPACTDSEVVQVTVNEVDGQNQCPVLTPIGDKTVNEGLNLTFTATATDADAGQTLTFSLGEGAPTGVTLDANSGLFNWTPTEEQGPGVYPITIRVFDTGQPACADSETINVTVNEVGEGNQCPVLTTIGNQTVTEGQLLTFTAMATDPDVGQTLTFTLDPGFPTGAAIDAGSGVFTFTPTPDQGPGTYTVTVRVTDNADPACSDFETITVTVNDVTGNQCPVLEAIGNQAVTEGSLLTFDANATDPDVGQTLTFSLDAGFPTGAAIDPSTGVFTWTPTPDQGPGTYPITIRVTDNGDPACSDFEEITVTVNDLSGNNCPELAGIGNRTVTEGELLTFTATATDPDAGQTLTFSLDPGFPTGAAIDPGTGVFTFTPTADQGPGTYTVTVRVTDNADPACSDFETITITVNEVGGGNNCPELASIGNRTVDELTMLTFTATATDPDAGQTLTFSLDPGFPTGAAIDPGTGVFTFTPTEEQGPGTYTVTVRVTDNADPACSDFETITITVNEVGGGGNQCPVIQPIAGQTVTEGETVTFTVTATDPENETLVYSLIGAPPGAQIHPLTGVFTWTPTNSQSGTYTITVQVRDTCEEPCTVTATVTIVVKESQPANECPTVQGIANRTVHVGELLSLDADATDPDAGQTVTFSLDPGFPAGASIDPVTGAFTFTPTHEQIGDHTVVVRGTDNGDPPCSDTEEFTITVEEEENQCPVLAPIGDKTVTENETLTFTVTATDPENDEIIFSIDAGGPAGAVINANTGVFTWTPTSEQGPGTYDITIRATDLCLTPCSDTETIQITVRDVGGANECPVLESISDKTVTEGETLTFTATATDAENDEIIFSLDAGAPAGSMIHANTGVFTWTPTFQQGPGTYEITIRATDLCTTPCSDTETIEVTVLEGGGGGGDNECPVLSEIDDMSGAVNTNIMFTATATDPDPGQLTFSLVDAPSGATIHPTTGAFLWVPMEEGSFTFTVRVTDPEGCSDNETVKIKVTPAGSGGGASTVLATFVGGDKTTKLWTGKPETCVHLEIMGDAEIDFSTVELVYNGQRIAPREAERSRDTDRDGNREATVCFSKQDLRGLFAGLPSGDNTVAVQITGRFTDGSSWTADVNHRVAVRGGSGHGKPFAAPNPLNPSTVLSFGTSREGSVKIDVFDLSGRLIRTLYEGSMPAGDNSVSWDGTGSSGGRVSSGVYYFRVSSVDGQDVVRVTVLK